MAWDVPGNWNWLFGPESSLIPLGQRSSDIAAQTQTNQQMAAQIPQYPAPAPGIGPGPWENQPYYTPGRYQGTGIGDPLGIPAGSPPAQVPPPPSFMPTGGGGGGGGGAVGAGFGSMPQYQPSQMPQWTQLQPWQAPELNFQPLEYQDFQAFQHNMTPQEEAELLAQLQYGSQESALNRALGMSQTQGDRSLRDLEETLARNIAEQQIYGTEATGAVGNLYDVLAQTLGQGQEQLGGLYQQAQGDVGAAYDQASQAMGQAGNTLGQSLSEFAGGLGQEDTLRDPMAQLQAEVARYQAQTAAQKAPAVANVATLGAQQLGVGQLGMSQSAMERTQRQSQILSDVQGTIGQLQLEGATGRRDLLENVGDQIYELSGQLIDLGSEKGNFLRKSYEDVLKSRNEEERQAKLDTLQQQVQLGGLELQQQSLISDVSFREFQATTQLADIEAKRYQIEHDVTMDDWQKQVALTQLADDRAVAQAQLNSAAADRASSSAGKQVNPLDVAEQELDIALKAKELGSPGEMEQGRLGVQQFLGQPTSWWGQQAGPKFSAELMGIIDSSTAGGATNTAQAYNVAMNNVTNSPSYLNKDALRTGIDIYFGNYR